ncbi:MAG TPA: ATP-binding cassette domain-containing protein [Rhizomicrobium sp.]|jgi:ABC-2 type transport system ATP-binding protein|nr:ATP-binding cassette domain-containing protein [Rhizomicrobium sp.]
MNAALEVKDVHKVFRRGKTETVVALDGVSFTADKGTLSALVGPDGAGKTTLLRLATGLLTADGGEVAVLGLDAAKSPQDIQNRVGYMPQRFGLYEDLTVQENLDLYADLHGVSRADRQTTYKRLMEMTALGPFTRRLAGQLSGGMKQKLGLACALVRAPELLLLDEPTAGVDPLSRQELWEIIQELVADAKTTVILSTAYLDEAERCGHAVVLHEGKVLAQGPPQEIAKRAEGRVFLADPPAGQTARGLQAQLLDRDDIADAVPDAGRVRLVRTRRNEAAEQPIVAEAVEPRFEDGFMTLLQHKRTERAPVSLALERPPQSTSAYAVEVHDLVRMFGSFTAVDHVSFDVKRGEIFGLLGPNGAGKTTTFRMLCGLLPATSGTLKVAGVDLRTARASARQHIGYVAQKFSLYGDLTVQENLDFFASAYGLRGAARRQRIAWALEQFELGGHGDITSGQLPGGFKQRLAMAAALLHEPDILFLDEPTSGTDPLARREFWRRITALGEQGVTIIVTTHFMEEAEYCDRVAILDGGRVRAQGTPAELRRHVPEGRAANMENAFIAVVEEARAAEKTNRSAA